MHQVVNKSRNQKGYACVLRPVKSTMQDLLSASETQR